MDHGDDFVLTGGRLVTPDRLIDHGWVHISQGTIVAVGDSTPPAGSQIDVAGAWIVPGFIDIHCHGAGGGFFFDLDDDKIRRAITTHQQHGTTTLMVSLISASIPDLLNQLASLQDFVLNGDVAGVHLEGPFLSPDERGAHDLSALTTPNPAAINALLEAGKDTIRMVTIAPELPGSIDAIKQLVSAGIVVAIGHTAATADEIRAAIDAGATVATHLFNGMPPLHHRHLGPVGVLLSDDRVAVEVIGDLVHLHPTVLQLTAHHAGTGRTIAVTDAMAAAGAADGIYDLGGLEVQVENSVATLVENGALAGSTLTMDVAFRNLVHGAGLNLVDAVHATSTTPARTLGLDHVGQLAPGYDADLVLLGDDLALDRVLRKGRWVSRL